MSSRPLMSVLQGYSRRLGWALVVVTAALLLFCGVPLGFAWFSGRNETREADEEIGRYLSLVQGRNRAGADAMLCGGDDTSVADLPGMDEPDRHLPRVDSFTIISTWDWSSVPDGHGRGYRIRLAFADESVATVEFSVEVIGGDPCIGTEIPL